MNHKRTELISFRGITRAVVFTVLLPWTFLYSQGLFDAGAKPFVSLKNVGGAFTLSVGGSSAPLWISSGDFSGVMRAAKDLRQDLSRVTSAEPPLSVDAVPNAKEIVLIGTLGKSSLVDKLAAEGKIDVKDIAGKWETYVIQVVENPLPNVDKALVIAGSDKRGTIFGIYDLSANIGVSPWYWWADVPVKHQSQLFVLPGRHSDGEPAVKYRGIFINDEAPALSGWTREKFGGFNHEFYAKVFELILRLRGNYLWPAMWGNAFYADDPENPRLADEYGVVIGTSHHEPMMRAHAEWGRGPGTWNYQTNADSLRVFWRDGIKRMGSYESLVTIGMRGDGDEPMSQDANISLLERIVNDQRQIIADVTGKDPATVPQVWALYKEVQEYYDKGMRVPDDVTLLLCDDNWGDIRKLPKLEERPRKGGYGIYYHFDYVGGPRNYKWLNTNQISRVWEQMHLAYEYGARQLWIVNVGDIKPMEYPISFFLDYGWNPGRWPSERLREYARRWAEQQFGPEDAGEIGRILTAYTTYNARRKPELLAPDTYSLTDYREAERIVEDYNALAARALKVSDQLPKEYRDAFFQLVLHPVVACANLNKLYVTVGRNRLYAAQGRAGTNELAAQARKLYARDSLLSYEYNNEVAGGKWHHMMDQTHIGYTYWQQPDYNSMPEVKEVTVPRAADMGVAIEGSDGWWPKESSEAVLPEFDSYNRQSSFVDVFNRGQDPFTYSVVTKDRWINIEPRVGTVDTEKRLSVSIQWQKTPKGVQHGSFTIVGPDNQQVTVSLAARNVSSVPQRFHGFVEADGFVSIEAEHFTKAVSPSEWLRIPDLGKTLSGMTPIPVTAASRTPGGESPRLEYAIYFFSKGDVQVSAYLSPTLNFHNTAAGLRYAVSFDDQTPQTVSFNADNSNQTWERWVAANINITTTKHVLGTTGIHVLKFWMVDPGIVLQKLVVDTGGVKRCYLGPPESYYRPQGTKDDMSKHETQH